jgi:flagellar hook-basal body complex protein FliE
MEIESVKLLGAVSKPLEGLSRAASAPAAPVDFSKVLAGALQSVDQAQGHADNLAKRFELGDASVTLEQAMVSMQTANVSFQALVQTRNKLISAYHDVMNMQV